MLIAILGVFYGGQDYETSFQEEKEKEEEKEERERRSSLSISTGCKPKPRTWTPSSINGKRHS